MFASGCRSLGARRKIACFPHSSHSGAGTAAPANRAFALTQPLSRPKSPRERMHTRAVTYDGYRRSDGLFDIEAHLVDTKDHDYPLLTGVRPAGTPIHEMWVRLTIDEQLTVHDIEAVTESMPYPGACNRVTPDYRRLVGANLAVGFRKRLHDARCCRTCPPPRSRRSRGSCPRTTA